jgi:hypothetical protein
MKTYVFSILHVVADVIGVYVSSDMTAAANLHPIGDKWQLAEIAESRFGCW